MMVLDSAARLDRRRVLETALGLIDRDGLGALTMCRLGSELEVDPMTIHHHLENKVGGTRCVLGHITRSFWDHS